MLLNAVPSAMGLRLQMILNRKGYVVEIPLVSTIIAVSNAPAALPRILLMLLSKKVHGTIHVRTVKISGRLPPDTADGRIIRGVGPTE